MIDAQKARKITDKNGITAHPGFKKIMEHIYKDIESQAKQGKNKYSWEMNHLVSKYMEKHTSFFDVAKEVESELIRKDFRVRIWSVYKEESLSAEW